jgi:hypothetical protein
VQDDFRRAVEPRIYGAGPDPTGCVTVHRSLTPSTACQPARHPRAGQDGNTTWKADLAAVGMAGQHEVHTGCGRRLEAPSVLCARSTVGSPLGILASALSRSSVR